VHRRLSTFFFYFWAKSKPTFEAPSYYFHENKTFPSHFHLSKRGVRNVWAGKTSSGIVFADLTLPFLRKKSQIKKFTPKILPPERGEKYFDSKNFFRNR